MKNRVKKIIQLKKTKQRLEKLVEILKKINQTRYGKV